MLEMQMPTSYNPKSSLSSFEHYIGSQLQPYSDSSWDSAVPSMMSGWSGFDPYAFIAMPCQAKSYEQPQSSNSSMFSHLCSAICSSFYNSNADTPAPKVAQHPSDSTIMDHLSSVVASSKLNPEAAEFWPSWHNICNNQGTSKEGSFGSMSCSVNAPDVLEEGLQRIYLESIQANNSNADNSFDSNVHTEQRQAHQQKSQQMDRSASAESDISASCRIPTVDGNVPREIEDICDNSAQLVTTRAIEDNGEIWLQEGFHSNVLSEQNLETLNSIADLYYLPEESGSNSEAVKQDVISPKEQHTMPYDLPATPDKNNSLPLANSVPSVYLSSIDPNPTSLPMKNFVIPTKEMTYSKPLYAEVVKGKSSKNDPLEDNLETMESVVVSSKVMEENEDERSGLVSCVDRLPALEDEVNGVSFGGTENVKESTNSFEGAIEDEQSEDEDDSISLAVIESHLNDIVMPFLDLVGGGRCRNLSECSSLSSDSIVFSDSCGGIDFEDDGCCPDTSEFRHQRENDKQESISLQVFQVDFSEDEDDIIFAHSPVVGVSSAWIQETSNIDSNVPGTRVKLDCGLVVSFDDSDEDECDDEDDDQLAVIIEVNQRWDSHSNDLPEKPKNSTKVRFKEAVMIKEVPADEDRKGPWAQYALDTERFRKRIDSCEKVLSPMLCPAHRDKVFSERFEGSA